MQRYKVTLILTADEFMGLVPHLGPINGPKIEKIADKAEVQIDQSAMRGQVVRTKRKSKVVETILNVLQDGPAEAGDLRQALVKRGMSESSLSTGLSILQKSGQIRRGDNGEYNLAVREAA